MIETMLGFRHKFLPCIAVALLSPAMALRAELNIPANLTALGVKAEDLDMLTEMALEDPSCGGNPVVMTQENTRALFGACM